MGEPTLLLRAASQRTHSARASEGRREMGMRAILKTTKRETAQATRHAEIDMYECGAHQARGGVVRLAGEKRPGRSVTSPVSDRPGQGIQGGVASLAPSVVAQRRVGVNQVQEK